MKKSLAGHEWLDEKIDSTCIHMKSDGGVCNMTRATLFQATEDDINKIGYAHQSHLSNSEYIDIKAEREAYEAHCEKLMNAVRQVCG